MRNADFTPALPVGFLRLMPPPGAWFAVVVNRFYSVYPAMGEGSGND